MPKKLASIVLLVHAMAAQVALAQPHTYTEHKVPGAELRYTAGIRTLESFPMLLRPAA